MAYMGIRKKGLRSQELSDLKIHTKKSDNERESE